MILPCRRGDFVDCLFPFAERPARPGPMRHIVYVRAMVRLASGALRAHVMLTTTSPSMVARIPEGLAQQVTEASSRRMGMRNSFVVDVHRLALLPLIEAWFPGIGSDRFVIGRADDRLQAAITRRYDDMLGRFPNPAENLGPKA